MEDTTSYGGTFQDTKIRAFNRGCQGTWRDIRNEHSPGYEDWGFELAVENESEAVNIPPGQLRRRLGELPRDKEINVFCRSAQRSYCATRILLQNGFKAKNISGGMFRRYGSVVLIAAMALPNVDPGLYVGIIPLALLAQYHLLDLIGENQMYPSNRQAIIASR